MLLLLLLLLFNIFTPQGCIMNSFLRNPSPSQFSSCSSSDLHSALDKGVGGCIYNSPLRLFTDPICGNAFVEEGEECDCGSLSECPEIDPCCEPGVCKLYQWAKCGSGDCCHNCSYTEQGVLCRDKTGLYYHSYYSVSLRSRSIILIQPDLFLTIFRSRNQLFKSVIYGTTI